jgi:hypothetical protein
LETTVSDDTHLILDVVRTKFDTIPSKPKPKSNPSPLEELAHVEAVEDWKDKAVEQLQDTIDDVVSNETYKHVEVNMRGVNGNALVILGTVKQALHRAGAPPEHIQAFIGLAMSSDYENLLATCASWVTIVDRPVDCGSALGAFKRLPLAEFVREATKDGD